LHAYLQQHERHANEVRLMHECNSNPLALVASQKAQWILLCSSIEKAKNYYWYKSMSMILSLMHLLLNFISQSPRGIFINQSKYALESLKKYGFESCDPVDTPMVEKSKLDEDKAGTAARPTEKHLNAVKRIFRYLKGTVHRGLWYPKDSSFALTAFADVDHAGCQDTRRSTSGSIQLLGDSVTPPNWVAAE
ncbi:hypothetical protein Tco_1190493, partial [Tanacetum coccineum]